MFSASFAVLVAAAGAAPHEDRLAQIKQIQNTSGVHWQAGVVDRFASEAPGASKTLCGVKPGWNERIAELVKKGKIKRFSMEGLQAQEIPESFDSEQNWPHCAKTIGDIRDQSNCGCCWAFAGAEAASDRMCIASKGAMMVPLSTEDVCFCGSNDGCNGGGIEEPWDYIQQSGAVSGSQYHGSGPFGKGMCSDFSLPHCHHHGPQGNDPFPAEGQPGCPHAASPQCPTRCDADASGAYKNFEDDKYTFSGDTETASGVEQVQRMIMAGGPVETAFTVYTDFENYVGGVYHHVSGDMAGGHAVKLVGWGTDNGVDYWKVANSWNPHWAEKGYFRIRRATEGIEDSVIGSSHTATWSKKGEQSVVV